MWGLHVVVHAVSKAIVIGNHVLALWLLGLKHGAAWLEISLKCRAISHRNIGHSVTVLRKASKGPSMCMAVEWIEGGRIEKHLRWVTVSWE
jgi:hypothetical protein